MVHYANLKQKITEKFIEAKLFIQFVVNHFIEDDCTYRASALAFTTLLAIVPLMSVGFAVLSSFPVFQSFSGPLQDFIFENFVPATGKAIQNYLQLFATQVSKLSAIGVIFLFITALLVMYTIERSMNKIWRVSSPRQGTSAFLLYWGILSLAPFLLGLSLAASSYFFSMPLIRGYYAPFLLSSIPFLLSLVGFTFLYVVVPNCEVRFTHGFYGALVATLLFESAKHAFGHYLTQYGSYQLLYGAFAIIPLFFLWVYWVWVIILIGAEISYALSVHHQRRQGMPLDGFVHALLWLHILWRKQLQGRSVTLDELINISSQPFCVDIGKMLAILSNLKLIQTTSDSHYILSRDLSYLTFYDLIRLLPYRFPHVDALISTDSPIAKRWHRHLRETDQELKEKLSITLDELFRENKDEAKAVQKMLKENHEG
ncbi:YihY family inner membrane protein [Legionella septentrionalis]|uniref:YihY family inner membrane protein n=1 Tax=Legionella septentrionalis TaxID=2498109 RepID=UPI000F8C4B63|nr:YihY family inner membrane protein [Legionella septentrionalis]RUQ99320.1 YihY family inner membrane protein [Legionella septentrionalis]RUR14797.1 YihY family inner membrane protein [Legionella septentrionalis]